ncbi:MAG: thiamine/molybdopterin biosynthesis protein [Candidatus Acidoferrum typicum]|nr:thiamine/molybdopterin biosynthesis protein [Candidatus Acidoferrum typicum]
MATERFARQSFLGPDADERIANCTVGLAGLGGGGSHVVQQLAHIGFRRYVLFDGDIVEESNLNRLVGAKSLDVRAETPKLHIAKTVISGLQPSAEVRSFAGRWQERPELLRECEIVFGCIDGYQGRSELEMACRRYMMHYIDIGMDVHGEKPPVIGGQVILSSPGNICMRCMGFLTDAKLKEEAEKYGKAGGRPQVVWPNGILASAAVGLAVDLVTGWTKRAPRFTYIVFDGNENTLKESLTLRNLALRFCPHFSDDDLGDPIPIEL